MGKARAIRKRVAKPLRRKQGSPSGILAGGDILSEGDLGSLAVRSAKTHKGRKVLKSREPQIREGPKKSLFLKANKTSSNVRQLLLDLHQLRKPESLQLSRRQIGLRAFDNAEPVEYLSQKNGATLFCVGSSSKRRPFSVTFGRTFDGELLDMYGFHVSGYIPFDKFKGEKVPLFGCKPLVICQGAGFDSSEIMGKIKNFFCDFFSGPPATRVCLKGLERVVVLTAIDDEKSSPPRSAGGGFLSRMSGEAGHQSQSAMLNGIPGSAATANTSSPNSVGKSPESTKILFRHYVVALKKSAEGPLMPRVELNEVGPSFELTLDRFREPERDRWKAAMRLPKVDLRNKRKNLSRNEFGDAVGRIHVGVQPVEKIYTPHFHLKGNSQKRERQQQKEERDSEDVQMADSASKQT